MPTLREAMKKKKKTELLQTRNRKTGETSKIINVTPDETLDKMEFDPTEMESWRRNYREKRFITKT